MTTHLERNPPIAPHLTPQQRAFMALETPAIPVIPDGWRMVSITEFGPYYQCLLGRGTTLAPTWTVVGAVEDTWIEALTSAIDQVLADARRDAETALALEGAER